MVWVAPTTLKPAEAAKRAGMGEADFRAVNHIPPRMTIRAGSSLLVPRPAHIEKDVTEHVADNGQLTLAPEAVPKRVVKKGGKPSPVVASKGKGPVRHNAKLAKHNPAKSSKAKPVQLAKK
jgi:membrane-bound lytic murein transglycosylase D